MKAFILRSVLALLVLCSLANFLPAYAADNTKGKELYNAVIHQNILKTNSLLAVGADVNHKENGRPIIAWAAQSGNADEEKASAEKIASNAMFTFKEETKNWSQLLTEDPSEPCRILESVAAKYGAQ